VIAAPFFASAFFVISAVFAVFAPLPIIGHAFRSGRRWAWLGALTNAALIYVALGSGSLAIFSVFVIFPALAMAEAFLRRWSPERAIVFTLFVLAVAIAAVMGWYSHIHHIHPLTALQDQVNGAVDSLVKQADTSAPSFLNGMEPDEWKKTIFAELPSALAVMALVAYWANFMVLFRLNPSGFRERAGLAPNYLKTWRAPAYLVWPTIASGFLLLWDGGITSDIGLNVFRVLMAVYAIQGLSVVSFFMDAWHVRGVFRIMLSIGLIFFMMPLLLAVGFFDLWFDFRAKIRQS
jgi:uncharacterized protein YybS (DUF2232 family)